MLLPEDISLKDLKYILTVAKYQSFVQAAEALSVSQPALSKQIKRFEINFKLKLFERGQRQFLITEQGHAVLNQIQCILDEADTLIRLADSQTSPLSGPFTLGVIASACAYLLPHFVDHLKETYPELELFIYEGLTEQLINELKEGKLNAVIAATTFFDNQLNSIPLYFEPFIFAYNPEFERSYKKEISAKSINTKRLLLLGDGHCLKDQTLGICSYIDTHTANSYRATSIETLVQLILSGAGTAILPFTSVITDFRFQSQLQYAMLKHKNDGRNMALYYRKTASLKVEYELLADVIKTNMVEILGSLN